MEDMKNYYIDKTKFYVNSDSIKAAGSKILPKDSVIASCVGNFSVASINKTNVIINQQLQAFIPTEIKAEYLLEIVKKSISYFESIGTAATLIYVNQQGFENLPTLVPPYEEQLIICNYINSESRKYESLLDKCTMAVTLLKERRTALISAAVTGKIDVRDWKKTRSSLG